MQVIVNYEKTKDWKHSLKEIKTCEARPAWALLSLIPASIQKYAIYNNFKTHPSLAQINAPSILQALVTVIVSFLFFLIAQHLLKNTTFAFLATLVYSLLASSNLYIRHMVPYDYALCFFMLNLYLFIRAKNQNNLTIKTAIISGLINCLIFMTYPGYYWALALNGLLLIIYSKRKFSAALGYGLSFIFLFIVFILTYKTLHYDYLKDFINFSSTHQGSYDEAFYFVFRFLTQVEGWIGWVISILLFLPIFLSIKSKSFPLRALWLLTLAGYLFHSFMSYFVHRFVFNGRVLHLYLPLIVLGVITAISYIRQKQIRTILYIFILVSSLYSFHQYFPKYKNLEYPLDLRTKFEIALSGNSICINNRWEDNGERSESCPLEKSPIIFVNLSAPFPIPTPIKDFVPNSQMILIHETLHPWNFSAYQFEGFHPDQRKLIKSHPFWMRIYVHPALKKLKDAFNQILLL